MDAEEMSALDRGAAQEVVGRAAIGRDDQQLGAIGLRAQPGECRLEAVLGATADEQAGHSPEDTLRSVSVARSRTHPATSDVGATNRA